MTSFVFKAILAFLLLFSSLLNTVSAQTATDPRPAVKEIAAILQRRSEAIIQNRSRENDSFARIVSLWGPATFEIVEDNPCAFVVYSERAQDGYRKEWDGAVAPGQSSRITVVIDFSRMTRAGVQLTGEEDDAPRFIVRLRSPNSAESGAAQGYIIRHIYRGASVVEQDPRLWQAIEPTGVGSFVEASALHGPILIVPAGRSDKERVIGWLTTIINACSRQ